MWIGICTVAAFTFSAWMMAGGDVNKLVETFNATFTGCAGVVVVATLYQHTKDIEHQEKEHQRSVLLQAISTRVSAYEQQIENEQNCKGGYGYHSNGRKKSDFERMETVIKMNDEMHVLLVELDNEMKVARDRLKVLEAQTP